MAYHAELNSVPPNFHSFYGYYQAYRLGIIGIANYFC